MATCNLKFLRYTLRTERLLSSAEFAIATADELRVLLALIVLKDSCTVSLLAENAGVAPERAIHSLSFWKRAGVLSVENGENDIGPKESNIFDEYDEPLNPERPLEEPRTDIAAAIDKNRLKETLFDRIAKEYLGRDSLSDREATLLAKLITQYRFDNEYILTLAAYVAAHGTFNINRLVKEAGKLYLKDILTVDRLDDYLKARENETDYQWRLRNLIGIYGRNLSKEECDYAAKWSTVYGYSDPILEEAYSITVRNKTHFSFPYMDSVLTRWHDLGCKTLEECKAASAGFSAEKKAEIEAKSAKKPQEKKSGKEQPRYGDFDTEEVVRRALERSFAVDVDEDDEDDV